MNGSATVDTDECPQPLTLTERRELQNILKKFKYKTFYNNIEKQCKSENCTIEDCNLKRSINSFYCSEHFQYRQCCNKLCGDHYVRNLIIKVQNKIRSCKSKKKFDYICTYCLKFYHRWSYLVIKDKRYLRRNVIKNRRNKKNKKNRKKKEAKKEKE